MNHELKALIEKDLGCVFKLGSAISGGSISKAVQISNRTGQKYFVKYGACPYDTYQKESLGLIEIGEQEIIKVPKIIAVRPEYLIL